MAAAAYNAGPGRPRKWRDGPVLDAAVWVENIPVPGDARLRQEGALEQQLLRRPARRPTAPALARAPRPDDRPARSERAAAGERPALTRRRRRSARIAGARTGAALFPLRVQTPRPRRDRLRRPQRLRKAGRALGRRRRPHPRRDARIARALATCSCCRPSRSPPATSTTTRRSPGCCATPTR